MQFNLRSLISVKVVLNGYGNLRKIPQLLLSI